MQERSRHRCLIYDGPPSVHLPQIATVAAEHLAANYRCLYLNSPPMVAGFRSYLAATGINTTAKVASGALVLSSDQDHLIAGAFDTNRMLAMLEDALKQALSNGHAGLWASGDILWEFGSEENIPKLLTYEIGLDRLLRAQPKLCGICQYHRSSLPAEALRAALYTHETLYINETLARFNPHYWNEAVLVNSTATKISDSLAEILKTSSPE